MTLSNATLDATTLTNTWVPVRRVFPERHMFTSEVPQSSVQAVVQKSEVRLNKTPFWSWTNLPGVQFPNHFQTPKESWLRRRNTHCQRLENRWRGHYHPHINRFFFFFNGEFTWYMSYIYIYTRLQCMYTLLYRYIKIYIYICLYIYI